MRMTGMEARLGSERTHLTAPQPISAGPSTWYIRVGVTSQVLVVVPASNTAIWGPLTRASPSIRAAERQAGGQRSGRHRSFHLDGGQGCERFKGVGLESQNKSPKFGRLVLITAHLNEVWKGCGRCVSVAKQSCVALPFESLRPCVGRRDRRSSVRHAR
eukprot:891384-Prymnesium_polylepis.1